MGETTGPAAARVPDGFFDEVAAQLSTATAEELSDAVITVCLRRGLLTPELADDDPADEVYAAQVEEVFALVAAATAAVADGTLLPHGEPPADEPDPQLEALWRGFVADAADPQSAAQVDEMVETGALAGGSR